MSTYDSSCEKIFNKIYSGMSYGAAFNSTAGNLIDNMNYANEAIKDRYRGIVLVFDEFGRYVEDYGEVLKVKAVQDLAEYCDHSDYNNHLILVSHKQLSMYTNAMKKSISDEWKKVEGRFKATSINIKYDQCLSLIGNIIPIIKELNSIENDELRRGYYLGIINQRGVHWIDPEGKPELELAEDYENRANIAESRGYSRYADILRGVADEFKREARRNALRARNENDDIE